MKKVITYTFIFFCFIGCESGQKGSNQKTSQIVKTDSIKSDTLVKDTINPAKETNKKPIKNLNTTFEEGDHKLIMEEVSQKVFDDNFRYSNQVEKEFKTICDTSRLNTTFPYHYLRYVSKKQLEKHAHLIKVSYKTKKNRYGRDVQEATYRFGSQLQHTLSDNPKFGESSASYLFREIIEFGREKFFVFMGFYWEGRNYQVYSEKDGKRVIMNGIPQISPDGSSVLTTPFDAGTYFNSSNIELWKFDGNSLKKVISFSSGLDFGTPWRSYWLDNNTIYCELRKYKSGNDGKPDYTYKYCKITFQKK